MQNLGSDYLDHYERYFGNPIYRDVMEADDLPRKIQLLRYDNVFEECMTFASLGVSSYSNELLGDFFEVVVVVDKYFEHIPKMVFSIFRAAINKGVKFEWGSYFTGLEDVDREFVSATGKDTLYVTLPSPLPEDFLNVVTDNSFLIKNEIKPKVFMCLFISSEEKEFLKINGKEMFEDQLEEMGVDPFDLCRTGLFKKKGDGSI